MRSIVLRDRTFPRERRGAGALRGFTAVVTHCAHLAEPRSSSAQFPRPAGRRYREPMHARASILVAMLAVACSGNPSGSDFKSPAAIARALGCTNTDFTSVVGPDAKQGGCDYRGDSFSLTTTTRDGYADTLAGLALTRRDVLVLVGPHWLIVGTDKRALTEAKRVLGGQLRP